jgi:dynein heavy chain 1
MQQKIMGEDKNADAKIKDLILEWDKNKPVQGDISPGTALNGLSIFEGRVTRLKEDYDQVCRAKEALDLDVKKDVRLVPILEELVDLKSVWVSLSTVTKSISDVKESLWSAINAKKLKGGLDELLSSMKELPTRMRQYDAFEYIHDMLKATIDVLPLLFDLKSPSIRERHWDQLFKTLKIDGIHYSELTLGHLWDTGLVKNERVYRDVIGVAQGEMALEEYLKEVKDIWTEYPLELVAYQNKCRLIRGWDDLFAKCAENIASLSAMRHSPYYKAFEEEAGVWEEKLNRVHMLFDVWVDVQRQWVYLEGIFSGSADIRNLLPVETSRFQNINSEFMSIMKKVYKSPLVLDVLGIANVQTSFERLADLLNKIQKALGEYLEKERSSFPRFYFVGDEDLLEIIGLFVKINV